MLSFTDPIVYGQLISRYKRFFMDIELPCGKLVTAHVPNTGSMKGLLQKHAQVLMTHHDDPKRKTKYTVQAIEQNGGWVGVNTHIPNKLIKHSLKHQLLDHLSAYKKVASEVRYCEASLSRADFKFSEHLHDLPPMFLEIKSVTLKENNIAMFPDTVSKRAHKHVDELISLKKNGYLSAIFFIIQRQDCLKFMPAHHIDHEFAIKLKKAHEAGVIIKALCSKLDEQGVRLTHEVPVISRAKTFA